MDPQLQVQAVTEYIEDTLNTLRICPSMMGGLETIEFTYVTLLEVFYVMNYPELQLREPDLVKKEYQTFIRTKFPGTNRYLSGLLEYPEPIIKYLEEFETTVKMIMAVRNSGDLSQKVGT